MQGGSSGSGTEGRRQDPLVTSGLCFLAYVALLGILVGWLRHVDPGIVRQRQLPRLSLLDLELVFALLLAGAAWVFVSARGLFAGIPRGALRAVAGAALAAFVLTRYAAPREFRIYYDEHIYMNIGQSMAYARRAISCDDGRAEYGEYKIVDGQYNKQPNGYPYLVSLVFRLFGVSEWAGMNLNNILFPLSALLVFAVSWLLFDDWSAAVAAALVHVFTPQTIMWSNTAAAEPSTMTFALVAVAAVLLFVRLRTNGSLFFAVAALAFGVQFRPESMLLLPLALLLVLVMAPEEFLRTRIYWAGAAIFALLIPHLAHLWVVRTEPWGAETASARFGLDILKQTMGPNFGYLVKNAEYPVLFTALAIFALGVRGRRSRRLVVAFWFAMSFGVFLFFYAGSFAYGNDDRFALISAAPLAILAGYGAAWLAGGLTRFGVGRAASTAAAAAVLFGAFTQVLPAVRAEEEEAWEAREDVNRAREFAAMMPPDSIVLTHNPNMFLLWGKNAAQLYFADVDPGRIQWYLERFSGGVYFHYNYWCNVADEHLDSLCNEICKRYRCEVIAEFERRDYRYALIRLLGPRDQEESLEKSVEVMDPAIRPDGAPPGDDVETPLPAPGGESSGQRTSAM